MKKPGFILHLLFVVLPLLAAGQQGSRWGIIM